MSLFQRLFGTLLYVAGTTGSVLIREVSLIQRSLTERFHYIYYTLLPASNTTRLKGSTLFVNVSTITHVRAEPEAVLGITCIQYMCTCTSHKMRRHTTIGLHVCFGMDRVCSHYVEYTYVTCIHSFTHTHAFYTHIIM